MKNWRTTIGGALGALGSALVGVGVLPQLSGVPNKFLTYVAVAGFFCSAFGKFFTSLFAADATVLKQVVEQSNAIATQTNVNTVQIADAKTAIDTQLKT